MRHSGETQFAVLPVFSLLSSVVGSLTLFLRARFIEGVWFECGSPRICELSSEEFFSGLGTSSVSGAVSRQLVRVYFSVVRYPAHDVKPQLWLYPQLVYFILCGVFHSLLRDHGFGRRHLDCVVLPLATISCCCGRGVCCFTYAFHA